MPIYEYKCEQCGKKFEVLQKFDDDPLEECILCHEGPVKKLISASAFVLKGEGFYVNDYGKKKSEPETKNDAKKETGTTSSSDSTAKESTSASSPKKETAKAA